MNTQRADETTSRTSILTIGIILLTLATAVIHISLLFPDTLFILNGLGYLALLGAYLFLPRYRGAVRWVLMAYTAVGILAWVMIGEKSWPEGALGYITKGIEVLLILLLWLDGRRAR